MKEEIKMEKKGCGNEMEVALGWEKCREGDEKERSRTRREGWRYKKWKEKRRKRYRKKERRRRSEIDKMVKMDGMKE